MKTKNKKILLILFVLMLLFSINTKVYAFGSIIQGGDDFISSASTSDPSVIADPGAINNGVRDISGFLYNVLLSAGVVIAVIVATVLGIKFMIGGAEGQAKVKEVLVPFVAGCIIVFGAFGIWKIALTIGNRLDQNGGSTGTQSSGHTGTSVVVKQETQ